MATEKGGGWHAPWAQPRAAHPPGHGPELALPALEHHPLSKGTLGGVLTDSGVNPARQLPAGPQPPSGLAQPFTRLPGAPAAQ